MRSRSSFRRWTPSRWATHWNSAPVAPGWPDWQGRVVFDCLGVAAVTVLRSPWGGGEPIKFSCKMNPIVSCELLLLHFSVFIKRTETSSVPCTVHHSHTQRLHWLILFAFCKWASLRCGVDVAPHQLAKGASLCPRVSRYFCRPGKCIGPLNSNLKNELETNNTLGKKKIHWQKEASTSSNFESFQTLGRKAVRAVSFRISSQLSPTK